jgi:hypothetical protein
METDRRQFDRIGYPEDFRPKLIIEKSEGKGTHGAEEYKVVDICKRGIKFTSEENVSGFRRSAKVEAQIDFCDGELLVVNGEVLRCIDNQVVIYPSADIPSTRIVKEKKFTQYLYGLGFS